MHKKKLQRLKIVKEELGKIEKGHSNDYITLLDHWMADPRYNCIAQNLKELREIVLGKNKNKNRYEPINKELQHTLLENALKRARLLFLLEYEMKIIKKVLVLEGYKIQRQLLRWM